MRRFRDLSKVTKAWVGFGTLALAGVAGAAGLQLASHDSKIETQVLGATAKKPPVAPTITSDPADPTNSTSATFAFKTTPTPASYECKLDNGSFAPCTSPKSYSGLGAGPHTFQVRALDGGFTGDPASRGWNVDLTPPIAPTLSVPGPENPTFATTAQFAFADKEAGVTFECRLDSSAQSCASPFAYNKVSVGDHTFTVVAIDPAGNRSGPSTPLSWTVLINKAFGISGNAAGPLYPGMTPTPLNLKVSNPYNFAIRVVSVDVSVAPADGCGTANLTVQSLAATHPTAIVVPANSSVMLTDLKPTSAAWPSDWPTIAMNNSSVNQDVCKSKTFTLSYTGTATKS